MVGSTGTRYQLLPGYLGHIKAGTDTKAVREGSVTLDWHVDDDDEVLSSALLCSDFKDKSSLECVTEVVGGFPDTPHREDTRNTRSSPGKMKKN